MSQVCPVNVIASEFDATSAAREAADGEVVSPSATAARKLQLRRDLGHFEDKLSHLRSAATFDQATSIEGAMFQIGVAFDDLQELADELPPEFHDRLRRVDRALYSAAQGIASGTGKRSPAMTRLMPSGLSPFGSLPDKATGLAIVRG